MLPCNYKNLDIPHKYFTKNNNLKFQIYFICFYIIINVHGKAGFKYGIILKTFLEYLGHIPVGHLFVGKLNSQKQIPTKYIKFQELPDNGTFPIFRY